MTKDQTFLWKKNKETPFTGVHCFLLNAWMDSFWMTSTIACFFKFNNSYHSRWWWVNEFYHVQFLPINPFQTTVAAAVAPPSSVLELVSWVKSCFGSFRNTRRTVMLSLDPAAFAWATRFWATSSPEPPPSLRASWTRPGTSPGRTTSKKPSQARRM